MKKDLPKAPVLRIVPPPLRAVTDGRELASVLRDLAYRAEQGRVTGIVYAAMEEDGRYEADAIAECERSPVFTLGLLQVLADHLIVLSGRRR